MGWSKQYEVIRQTDGNQAGSRRILPGAEGMFNAIRRTFLFFQFARFCVPVCADMIHMTTTSGYIDHFAFERK